MQEQPWREEWDAQSEGWIGVTQADPMYEVINKPAFLELVPAPGHLTLDVGCGEGRLARELKACGHNVLGLDGAPSLARAASLHDDALAVAVGDIHRLPIRSAAADLVVCFMVLMDIDDLPVATQELSRVLEPRGRLCVSILHPIATSGLFIPGDEYPTFYMGEYLAPMRHVLDIERAGGDTFRFRVSHRPIEHYSRAFEQAGLAIEAIREPGPTTADVEQHPSIANWARVPDFLQLRAVKLSA